MWVQHLGAGQESLAHALPVSFPATDQPPGEVHLELSSHPSQMIPPVLVEAGSRCRLQGWSPNLQTAFRGAGWKKTPVKSLLKSSRCSLPARSLEEARGICSPFPGSLSTTVCASPGIGLLCDLHPVLSKTAFVFGQNALGERLPQISTFQCNTTGPQVSHPSSLPVDRLSAAWWL